MDKYMEEDMYDEGMHMMDMDTTDEGYGEYEEGYDSMMDEDMYDEGYGMEDEGVMYEIDMNDEGYEHSMMDEELTEDEINEMLAEMDAETSKDSRMVKRAEEASGMNKMQPKKSVSELEEMFQEMTMEELQEMNALLQEDDLVEVDPKQDYPMEEDYSDLTEAQIEEIMNSMREEDEIEESSAINSRTTASVGNDGADEVAQGRPDRRSLAEEDEEVLSLREQLKKLKQENKALNEGFTNKVKSLENKVYDVTISALKAGFVNKFLLEHPLRENEKLQIIHRFANAQTKEQIKETYISLTNEFAKGQTVKDGSMLNESVQNKVGKIHRADNALVKEKDLINESDESNRFKQLLNYNFGKKK